MDYKAEKDRLTGYLRNDLVERTTNCIDSALSGIYSFANGIKNHHFVLGVVKRKSEMYAYEVINCITFGGSRHVKQFWKFYRGTGTITSNSPTTKDYLRFMDLRLKCPNLTVDISDIKLPRELSAFKRDILVSKHIVLEMETLYVNLNWILTTVNIEFNFVEHHGELHV
jgi:hypothetical protein